MPSTVQSEQRLWGRGSECEGLDRLLANARRGRSGAVVVSGEPGVGKTALLDYLLAAAEGCRVARAAGVESEMELAFAGLHQLCAPFLDRVDRLPDPQRDALATAFGLRAGDRPNRFLLGLAVLSLLSDVAEAQPLVCLLDDAQWLDQASAQVLGFVARRLDAEAVVMIFAVRDLAEGGSLVGLPQLTLGNLRDADARELLASAIPGPLDGSVRDRIVAEARGNPLALLELPRAWTPAALAGGFGLPDGVSVSRRIEESFRRRLAPLPEQSRRLLLVAAAEPVGSPVLIWAAATRLGIPVDAAAAAADTGLLDVGAQLRFRHPLVRSVVYHDAPLADRRLVHAALATVTDKELDPDRRAWHLAAAASGPDEEVAVELERSAGRAQARGGIAAAAAFLQRAVALTADPRRRGERALTAAEASVQAGAFDAAFVLLGTAAAAPLEGFQRARRDLVAAHVAFASGPVGRAARLLMNAARRLEPFDPHLARETYLEAWNAASVAGDLAGDGVLLEICRAVGELPPLDHPQRPVDLLLEALALLIRDGHGAATPVLQRAAHAASDMPLEDVLQWGWAARAASALTWDFDGMLAISERQVQLVRDAGALAVLPLHLFQLATVRVWMGDFAAARVLVAESEGVSAATGRRFAPYAALRIRALEGREAEASSEIAGAIARAASEGEGMANGYARWAEAVLYNGLGRYDAALSAARDATSDPRDPWMSMFVLPELVEAAMRTGREGLAREALERLANTTRPAGTDFARGIEARCRALVTEGGVADGLYREAIHRLGRTRLRPELARTRLLYGEWLRRDGRRIDAREHLRAAYEMFSTIGMDAFAERARRELRATGETVRKRTVESFDELTPQEMQIARLATDGRTNPEIAAQLFLSPRTVEWHLRKVFSKLGIASRRELHVSAADEARTAVGA